MLSIKTDAVMFCMKDSIFFIVVCKESFIISNLFIILFIIILLSCVIIKESKNLFNIIDYLIWYLFTSLLKSLKFLIMIKNFNNALTKSQ